MIYPYVCLLFFRYGSHFFSLMTFDRTLSPSRHVIVRRHNMHNNSPPDRCLWRSRPLWNPFGGHLLLSYHGPVLPDTVIRGGTELRLVWDMRDMRIGVSVTKKLKWDCCAIRWRAWTFSSARFEDWISSSIWTRCNLSVNKGDSLFPHRSLKENAALKNVLKYPTQELKQLTNLYNDNTYRFNDLG